MTVHEAIVEMRYGGIPEEDIEDIMEICKKKGVSPQNIDKELEARGFDKVFSFEYDDMRVGMRDKRNLPIKHPSKMSQ